MGSKTNKKSIVFPYSTINDVSKPRNLDSTYRKTAFQSRLSQQESKDFQILQGLVFYVSEGGEPPNSVKCLPTSYAIFVHQITSSLQTGVIRVAAINISICWELGRVVQEKIEASFFYPEDGGSRFLRNVKYQAKCCQITEASNIHILVQSILTLIPLTWRIVLAHNNARK